MIITSVLLDVGLVVGSVLCLKQKPAARRFIFSVAIGCLTLLFINNWLLIREARVTYLLWSMHRAWAIVTMCNPAVKRALKRLPAFDAQDQPIQ